jgi:hypothetical protein
MRADRTKNGVPLPDDTWAAIVNPAREVGVSEVSIQRAAARFLRHCERSEAIHGGKHRLDCFASLAMTA